jgi:hypothetical protein
VPQRRQPAVATLAAKLFRLTWPVGEIPDIVTCAVGYYSQRGQSSHDLPVRYGGQSGAVLERSGAGSRTEQPPSTAVECGRAGVCSLVRNRAASLQADAADRATR